MVDDNAAPAPAPAPAGILPTLVAIDLQDHLMMASNDLDRLQRLLADAALTLMTHFHDASQRIQGLTQHAPSAPPGDLATPLQQALADLGGAVTALQFQDLASQLIAHTDQRLRSCADRLARDALAEDGEPGAPPEAPPLRPNPVTQDEVDAGSIELF